MEDAQRYPGSKGWEEATVRGAISVSEGVQMAGAFGFPWPQVTCLGSKAALNSVLLELQNVTLFANSLCRCIS